MKLINPFLSPKLKLYLPIVPGIAIAVVITSIYSVNKLKNNIYLSVERNLTTEVNTINKMLERESALKLEKVRTDLNIVHEIFYSQDFKTGNKQIPVSAINQTNQQIHQDHISSWFLNGKEVYNNFDFVDKIHELVGGTATIFQKIDSGYVRISTNVLKTDGTRAIGTYIPNDSPVVQTIEKGKTYIGHAFVVNDWYITAYEPIYENGKIIGMIYAGDKEKDLKELRDKISSLTIGKDGFAFILDDKGKLIVHPWAEGEDWSNEQFVKIMMEKKSGILSYISKKDEKKYIAAFDYFPDFRLYVVATLPIIDETQKPVREIIVNSVVTGLLIIIVFSILIYLVTAERVRKFLNQLELSTQKLKSAEHALEQSERYFQTLFNNSSDEIFVIDFKGNFIEVNQFACDSLGYSHEEFLHMNIRDIKPEKFIEQVDKNIILISKFGNYRYESENMAKDGRIIPVEMKSRVIDYKDQQAILTIARDITERKEIEEKILTTIIQTEENERKRFAADLHDDLAPILSTVKLYTDLLKKGNYKKISEAEAVKNIEELVDMAIKSTREISRNIRPNILQDFGLAAAINDFCAFINSTSALSISVNTSAYKIEKRGIEESLLYQAFKELINNTIRHSEAKNVKIELKSFDNQVILYYRDDGKGFDVNRVMKEKDGLGLNNIVNRIKSVQGSVDINSEEGKGMFLIASLKVNENR